VTSGNTYSTCAQTSTIDDPSGTVTMATGATRGFSINIPVPNCPGTTTYTVTSNIISSGPGLLGSVQTTFTTSDIATKPNVNAGLQTLNTLVVPDPAFAPALVSGPLVSPLGTQTISPLEFDFDGFSERLRFGFYLPNTTPALGFEAGFTGAFVNGQFLMSGGYSRDCELNITPCLRGFGFGGPGSGIAFFLGAPPLPANPTGQLLTVGSTIDIYPIASTTSPFDGSAILTTPFQISGPKIASVTLTL